MSENEWQKARKSELRVLFSQKRDNFLAQGTPLCIQDLERNIYFNLQKLFLSHKKGFWGIYCAFSSEVSLNKLPSLFPSLMFAYPRIEDSNLIFYQSHINQKFENHRWGFKEPKAEATYRVDNNNLVAVLVPGLAFDRHGMRLGWGKGYYDRFLIAKNLLKIGVAYSIQISELDLPYEQYDQRMDWLVTEDELYPVAI